MKKLERKEEIGIVSLLLNQIPLPSLIVLCSCSFLDCCCVVNI